MRAKAYCVGIVIVPLAIASLAFWRPKTDPAWGASKDMRGKRVNSDEHTVDLTVLPSAWAYDNDPPKFGFIGYIDEDRKVFYEWKGIKLKPNEMPKEGPTSTLARLDLSRPDYHIIIVDPPTTFAQFADGETGIAYINPCLSVAFRWKGAVFDRKRLGKGVSVFDASKFTVLTIDPPDIAATE